MKKKIEIEAIVCDGCGISIPIMESNYKQSFYQVEKVEQHIDIVQCEANISSNFEFATKIHLCKACNKAYTSLVTDFLKSRKG